MSLIHKHRFKIHSMFVVIGEYDDRQMSDPPDLLATFDIFDQALNYILSEYVTERISYDHRQDPLKIKQEALNMWEERGDLVFNDYYWYIFDTEKATQQKLTQINKILPHYEPLRNDCSCYCIKCDELCQSDPCFRQEYLSEVNPPIVNKVDTFRSKLKITIRI